MGRIYLKNISLYAYHGCMPEERVVGSDYNVNVKVSVDTSLPQESDRIQDTVDYASILKITTTEMAIPANLLENVAGRISQKILALDKRIKKVSVEVAKKNPPAGGIMDFVSVKIKQRRESPIG